MAPRGDTHLCLGAIVGAHGVRGEVRLKSFTEAPLDIASYGPLSSEDGTRRFEIVSMRETSNHVVATLRGIGTRDQAAALRGTRLYVDRDKLPEPDDNDTWYHSDLIGLDAMLQDGTRFGEVTAVYDYGAGDLLEIAPAGGGSAVLIPFTLETVPEVDLTAGTVTVVPMEGLVDDGT